MVPFERRCSFDFPIVWIGMNSTVSSSGSRARTVSIMPCMIAVSVMTGRCGPCCSIAATGRTVTVALGSSSENSLDFNSPQKRLFAIGHFQAGRPPGPPPWLDPVDLLVQYPSPWYSIVAMQHITPKSIRPPFARYSHGVEIPPGHRILICSGQLGIGLDDH